MCVWKLWTNPAVIPAPPQDLTSQKDQEGGGEGGGRVWGGGVGGPSVNLVVSAYALSCFVNACHKHKENQQDRLKS